MDIDDVLGDDFLEEDDRDEVIVRDGELDLSNERGTRPADNIEIIDDPDAVAFADHTVSEVVGPTIGGIIALFAASTVLWGSQGLWDVMFPFLLLLGLAQLWNLLFMGGVLSLAQHAFLGLAAFSMVFFSENRGLGILMATLCTVVLVTVLSLATGAIVDRVDRISAVMVTVLVAILLSQFVRLNTGFAAEPVRDLTVVNELTRAGRDQFVHLLALIVGLGSMVFATLFSRSLYGVALRAASVDPQMAKARGVAPVKLRLGLWLAWAVGISLAGAAIVIRDGAADASLLFAPTRWLLPAIVICVIGGIGTVEGPLLGTIVWVMLDAQFSTQTPAFIFFVSVLAVAMLLVAPGGVWGAIRRFLPFPFLSRAVPSTVSNPSTPLRR